MILSPEFCQILKCCKNLHYLDLLKTNLYTFLGVPFNIASYALLTTMMAHVTGLKPGDFVHTFGDTHIYKNHVSAMKEQIERKPRPFPKLHIKRKVENIEDFKWDDFEIIGYDPHPKISMDMAV